MELRHLRYFTAVAEELNITRAAARLHVSQPPLSRQIRDLEEELGVVLLERSPQEVILTPAGRMFYREAKSILERTEAAIEKTRAVVNGDAGVSLRVGYAPSPSAKLLPDTLRAFRKTMPQVQVELLDMSSEEMIASLRSKVIEMALLVSQPSQTMRGLIFETLLTMQVGVIVSPRHPLAKRKSVSVADIYPGPLVGYCVKDYPDYPRWAAEILNAGKGRLKFAVEADGATSLITAVEAERGVALAADTYGPIAGNRVKFIPLLPAPEPLYLGIARRKGKTSAAAEKFLTALKKAASELWIAEA